jgi:hypothetical protein
VACTPDPGDVPHRLHIPDWTFAVEPGQGEPTERIEEVWVYTERGVLGAFPLPADISLLQEDLGESESLTLLPGIRVNGVSASRKPYPFYRTTVLDLAVTPGQQDTLIPATGYADGVEVVVAEDFETANRFSEAATSTAEVVRTTDPDLVLDGEASGYIVLGPDARVLTATTNEQQYPLPPDGAVWLEIDYRCSHEFAVGLLAVNGVNTTRTPILVLRATEGERKKVYLDLAPVVRSLPGTDWWELTLDAAWDGTTEGAYVVVDNLKLVTFE